MADTEKNQNFSEVKPEVRHQNAESADRSKSMSSMGSGASKDYPTSPNADSSNATNQFDKPQRTLSKGRDIRKTLKYHDVESYVSQRHHFIGTGVFNADNIDDLPPRYRTKVLNAYEWLAATFPQANMTASDIIAIDTNNSLSQLSKPSFGSQNFRGPRGNQRESHNRPSFSNGINISSDQDTFNHDSYINHSNLSRSNSVRDDPRPEPSNFRSRDSSTSSKDSHQRSSNQYNKINNQRFPCSESPSLGRSSNEASNNFSKQYPNAKSFPQNKRSNEPSSRCESPDLSKVPNSQSVHSSERLDSREFDRNIPNRHSKKGFRDENHARNRQPDSHSSIASDAKQNNDGNRSRNNSFHPEVNERSNKFSDARNISSQNTNSRNILPRNDDSKLRSDNSYENNHSRTNSESSSIASDKRFHDNKRNKKSTNSSQSSNLGNRQSCEISTDESKKYADSVDAASNLKKGANYQNKNVSDGKNANVSNPSLQSPSKKQKHNRRNKYPAAELENGPGVKTSPPPYKNTSDSSRAFPNNNQSRRTFNENKPREENIEMDEHMNRVLNLMNHKQTITKEDQSKGAYNENKPREETIAMDEHMSRVLNLIAQKQNDHSINHTAISKTDKQFSQNDKYDRKSAEILKHMGGGSINTIQSNNSRHYDKSNSSNFPDSKSEKDNVQGGASHRRQNSQNSVSSEKIHANRIGDGGRKNHNRQNSQNSDSSGKIPANRPCDGGKNHNRQNSQNSVASEKMHANKTYDQSKPNISNNQSNANYNRTNSSKESFSRSDSRNSSSSKFNSSRNFEDRSQVDRGDSSRNTGNERYTSHTLGNSSQFVSSAVVEKQRDCKDERLGSTQGLNKTEEKGFFVSVSVSDSSNKDWLKFFTNALKHKKFELDPCCKFTDSLILSFEEKCDAIEASSTLRKLKQRKIVPGQPHLILVGNVKYRRLRPCDCQDKMVYSCLIYFKEFSEKYIQEHQSKMLEVEDELHALNRGPKTKFVAEQRKVLEESLNMLEDMERVYKSYINDLKIKLKNTAPNYFHICKLKSNFMRECHSFQRCLPIYSSKDKILKLLKEHSVTVISAETGSGKSTQLAEYLLQSDVAERGTIICTQPRKIAAISITNYVCGKIGSAVGKLVGFDVGTEKKFDKDTKIIYMTDYALLRKFIRNPRLKGISCVIIDEAHERTLHTDLLLGMLKEVVKLESDRLDLRVVITSATIDPSVFVRYFNFLKTAVIDVPGRAYPVEVVWLKEDVEIGWKYLKKCVETAVDIHTDQPDGDILVFLISPSEIDEAIMMFRDMYNRPQMPMLMSLHGKSDLQEQMRIFEVTPPGSRKIIFATNAAETSLTIPGIRYVIDCGMAKEMTFFPKKNKNCLMVTFINKSSAEQRKGRAGRTQPGICYRMYSERNYKEMLDRASPEILRTSLQSALLKIYELGFKPDRFDFVESPSKESIAKSLESLELLDLVKDECLTELGKKVVELPIEPRLAKLVLQGIASGVGYEMIIIAAMVREAGRLFVRADDIKVLADQKKIGFCQETGDLCTYLEVYKRWREVGQSERYAWCVENFISSKALNSAEKTIKDVVVSLHMDLSIHLIRRYNNAAFKSKFESIVFNCFSEHLCMYSGHPKVGYFSFILNDSLYIHPSSSLYYLGKDLPQFLVYSTLMQTSNNFLMDVTPIKESVVNKSYHKGSFKMSADVLKGLKIVPKTLGPFGDIVLRNHIIGKGGCKIVNMEVMIEKLTNARNYKIDIIREKGTIIIYSEERFHEKISQYIHESVSEAHSYLSKEEDIFKMTGFFYLCVGSGGIVNDIVMPGEFREVIVENMTENKAKEVETYLRQYHDLKNIRTTNSKKGRFKSFQIAATFEKVANAMEAKKKLTQMNLNVKSTNFVQESNEKEAPMYRIQVSWSRVLSEGVGWVEFDSEADCIGASGQLTSKSFYIGHNYIRFTPSDSSVKMLDMRNLPLIINEATIEKNLADVLKPFFKPKNIYIKQKKLLAGTNADVQQVQKKLSAQFGKFTPPNQMVVDVICPSYGEPLWRAVVYFENSSDGENAFKELNGKLCIDSIPVQLNAIRKSHLFCKSQVVKAVMADIEQLKKDFPTATFSFKNVQNDTMVDIGYSCKSMEDLFAVQQKLSKLFQGCTIQCQGNTKFSHLFTVRGHQLISEIQNSTKTLIMLDNVRKIISIHGPKNNSAKAQVAIYLLVEKEVSSKKKVFNLKSSSMPTGFLKCLYMKYGIDLQGLICDFNLKAAILNGVKGTLTIEGSSGNLRKASLLILYINWIFLFS